MLKLLPLSATLFVLLTTSCDKSKQTGQKQAGVETPAAALPTPAQLSVQLAEPKVGDVYVVQFQPPGATAQRYFFYHVFRATADSAYLHPANKPATALDADLAQPDFQPSANIIVYTKAELVELLREQPGDVNKARLVQVRRAD